MPVRALRQAHFLSQLTARELDKVSAIAREVRFQRDQVIVAAGSELGDLYVVSSGQVRVTVPIETAGEALQEEVLGTIGPGECFGEFSFADRKPASVSVVADEETVAAAISHHELDELLDAEPAIAGKVLRGLLAQVVGRFRCTDASLVLSRYVLRYL